MSIDGYSDRINHALAFAAKHHDVQVRKGTRLPYFTQPANVAVILARYDQDETTVVAGVLHEVVEDCVREQYSREMLDGRIAQKFGDDVLDAVLAVTRRRVDDDGVEMSKEEQNEDYLVRLADAGERARWVCAAGHVHTACTTAADLRRTEYPESVWARSREGREATIRWYRQVHDRLRALGFDAPIMDELRAGVEALERYAGPESTRTDR